MTDRTITPEPCPCGATSEIWTDQDGRFCVVCSSSDCWVGPSNASREQAIAAWNRVAGQRWRPIETAPRDGTEVIVAHDQAGVCSAIFCESDGDWWCLDMMLPLGGTATAFIEQPTHWRPLPEPPEGEGK